MAESLPSPFAPSRLPASADSPDSASHPVGDPRGDLSGAGAEILEALLQPRISLFWGAQAPTRSLLTAATTIAAGGPPVRPLAGGAATALAFSPPPPPPRPPPRAPARPRAGPARRPPDPYDILDR